MTNLHITSWVLAFILLFLVLSFYKQGKEKPGKIVHMILRLDYLFILYTGGQLIAMYFQGSTMLPEAITKALAGLWVIAAIEMVAIKTGKGKSAKSAWIQLGIAFAITLLLGFGRLPLGLLP
ncbi:YisL family protein [Aquibacillus sp. 3ASR75-11]|uniref:YisL family protein n=1 Tax=Terrihalobacillus insolitus TaxID=2950438 RepID=A0A9X3WTL5_9BACI|nr:YisL family protein [Terrihalobacillus insolitus]MDC3413723.1 YisL family protein [Terrihalobacillus insolitus]MDC3425582.1 YisL family protein [Terrihalobacillus insolitus]